MHPGPSSAIISTTSRYHSLWRQYQRTHRIVLSFSMPAGFDKDEQRAIVQNFNLALLLVTMAI